MDWLDRGAQQELAEREHSIRKAREAAEKLNKPGLSHCIDCGEEIPPKRQAIRGVTRCIQHQEEFELDGKRGL
ncbi:MAG TPA: TraR/DksA C4-type zinc finger protein [Methylophilaceae bacterium]|nr:TraR/DksA C4-type zinc finger protein [Methylophilaceae bacterium]